MHNYINVDGIRVYSDENQAETVKIIRDNIKPIVEMLSASWGIKPLSNCRIHVMDDLNKFLFRSSPIHLRPLVLLNTLINKKRLDYLWQHAGGWGKRYGNRYVIGIKTRELIEVSESNIGEKIFYKADMVEKIKHILCHELTHSCTTLYQMPSWLHEGLAMISVDEFLEKQTVKKQTLERFKQIKSVKQPESIEDIYIFGYWIVYYLDNYKPEILRRLLKSRNCYEDPFIKEVFNDFELVKQLVLDGFGL